MELHPKARALAELGVRLSTTEGKDLAADILWGRRTQFVQPVHEARQCSPLRPTPPPSLLAPSRRSSCGSRGFLTPRAPALALCS